MRKRPLCFLALVLAAVLLFLDKGGLSGKGKPPDHPVIQELIEKGEPVEVFGEADRWETYETGQYLYLKHTILPYSGEQIPLHGVKVKIRERKKWKTGELVRVRGVLTLPEKGRNPGQFDSRAYLACRDIYFQVEKGNAESTGGEAAPLGFALQLVREYLERGLDRAAPVREAGVLRAMLLGEKKEAGEEIRLLYQISAMSHLLAVSGLHVALLSRGIQRVLRLAGMGIYGSLLVSAVLLIFYGMLAGGSVSAIRAVILFCLSCGARLLGRTYDGMTALAAAASLLLISNPQWLYDSGFQLSFGAVLGVTAVRRGLFGPGEGGKGKKKGVKNRIREGAEAGVAVWLTTLPLMLYYFYEISLYGFLINLFVIPTAGIVLGSGLLGGILGGIPVLDPIARVAAFPAVLLLRSYEGISRAAAQLPGAVLILGRPKGWAIALYYACLLMFCFRKKMFGRIRGEKRVKFALGAAFLVSLFLLARQPREGTEITMLDVGQGDALAIETEQGGCVMTDGGSTSEYQAGKYRILPYLKYRGVREVDLWILSHPDLDHYSGFLEILQASAKGETALRVETLLLPAWMRGGQVERELIQAARAAGTSVVYGKEGDRIRLGGSELTILHPDGEDYGEDPNGGSLTFLLEAEGRKGLFTGDLTGEQEKKLLGRVGDCDFLKAAHHGSASSTGEEFLSEVRPELTLVSSGADNPYGHPSPDFLQRVRESGSHTLGTQELGAVRIRLQNGAMEVEMAGGQ